MCSKFPIPVRSYPIQLPRESSLNPGLGCTLQQYVNASTVFGTPLAGDLQDFDSQFK